MKKKYQGELMPVVRKNGTSQMIFVYENSSDFPDYDLVIMDKSGDAKFQVERIPMNEELWRRIGKALNYRFVIKKSADDRREKAQ